MHVYGDIMYSCTLYCNKRACLKKTQSTNMHNYFVVKEKQQGLPGSTVHWIIAGVTIGFCVVLLLVAAVALKRRSRGLFTPNYTG